MSTSVAEVPTHAHEAAPESLGEAAEHAELLVGPLLRYVGSETATIWVETTRACEVAVLGRRTRTFHVEGHHYALLMVTDLEPGTTNPYDVRLDDVLVWPRADDERPRPSIRMRDNQPEVRLAFGSCRIGAPERLPYTYSAEEHDRGVGVDALWAYARALQEGLLEYPDALVLLGDQVYADELPPETAQFVESRRDGADVGLDQVADFEEYTHLYRESWSNPDIRWLLSTVPSTMIFDDHEVHDDWNISDAWIEEMRSTPWWRERITGAFVAYFLYQHLGNLSPPELAAEPLLSELQSDDDGGPRLREHARMWDEDRASSRWSYYRDFGRSRLLVIDSRAARIVAEGRRQMMAQDEWDWIVEHAHGSFDHLVIATSVPAFLPHGIHHLEAWNEAVCDGAWGTLGKRLGERLRRAVDLEHWSAYELSFRRLTDLLRSVGQGLGGDPPVSITILSGDVHVTYVAEIDAGRSSRSTRIRQIVCSPFRNPLKVRERRVVRATGSRAAATIFSRLARLAGVQPVAVSWELSTPRTFENSIGQLELGAHDATVTLFRTGSHPDLDLGVAYSDKSGADAS
jgi:phosphodiesterase/alkaline phosphatase D-like protein